MSGKDLKYVKKDCQIRDGKEKQPTNWNQAPHNIRKHDRIRRLHIKMNEFTGIKGKSSFPLCRH